MAKANKDGVGAVAPTPKASVSDETSVGDKNDPIENDLLITRVAVLERELEGLKAERDLLRRQLDLGGVDVVIHKGRKYRIAHGPIAAKWVLDEVKKGFLEEDRLVVALGD